MSKFENVQTSPAINKDIRMVDEPERLALFPELETVFLENQIECRNDVKFEVLDNMTSDRNKHYNVFFFRHLYRDFL